jgi:hypothetical protein
MRILSINAYGIIQGGGSKIYIHGNQLLSKNGNFVAWLIIGPDALENKEKSFVYSFPEFRNGFYTIHSLIKWLSVPFANFVRKSCTFTISRDKSLHPYCFPSEKRVFPLFKPCMITGLYALQFIFFRMERFVRPAKGRNITSAS